MHANYNVLRKVGDLEMLPKKNSKRETVSFRVDGETWKFLTHLKKERYIDVSSWMRAVLSSAIEKVKAEGHVTYQNETQQ